ncbi:SCAN box domain-containing protein [Trichonephila clavipes]|nr:SCAN box domain-containing protein [Trichonephila clavipes]
MNSAVHRKDRTSERRLYTNDVKKDLAEGSEDNFSTESLVIGNNKKEVNKKKKKGKSEWLERAKQHELELRKLEFSQQNQPLNDKSGRRVEIGPKIQLTQITTKFDEKHDEISLYLINFERKAELAQVPKKDWVAYLLAVLPARYKLNSEKLKQCFYRHQKSAEKSWRNYAHELNSYFTEWIAELQVKTFEQLKDLLITEQLKYRVPAEPNGFPRELQTDQGTSFMSALTTEFLERFGVKVVRSYVYHPQSNPVERMHRTLKKILRVLCLESIPDWEKILPQALLFALRTVIHDSTGFSPAELVHGKI